MGEKSLAQGGDTWGIPGPTFSGFYACALLGLVGVALLARRLIRGGRPTPDSTVWLAGPGATDPYLAAYLNGAAELALLAAVTALRADRLVAGDNRRCWLAANPPTTARPALEQAVLAEAGTPRTLPELAATPSVSWALNVLRDELIRRRLWLTEAQRERAGVLAYPLLGLLGLGFLRLVAGVSGGKPVEDLVVLMIVVAAAAIWLRRKPAARSVAGDRLLAELREGHQVLKPALSPSWGAYGALGAALAVAVFGTRSLWTADPEFARALSAAKDKFGPAAQSSGNSSSSSNSCSSSSCGSSGCGG